MTSIFVAKLDFNTTDEELKSLFEKHGKVNRVTIAKDRETGKPRGFAFVEMQNENEADAAIQALDNTSVNGRTIAVKKADDRAKPQGSSERGDRPPRPENKPYRHDRLPTTDEKPPHKKSEEGNSKPIFNPDEVNPLKTERKKEKDAFSKKEKPKQHKMEAYKKSGKSNRFFEEDDEDWDYAQNRKRSSGWDEEE